MVRGRGSRPIAKKRWDRTVQVTIPGFLSVVLIIAMLWRACRMSWSNNVVYRSRRASVSFRIGRIFSRMDWRDSDIGVAGVRWLACYGGRCKILGSICGVGSRRDDG